MSTVSLARVRYDLSNNILIIITMLTIPPALSLILAQLPRPTGLLFLALGAPLGRVAHIILNVMNPLQRVETLIQKKGRVVHHHVDKLDEVLEVIVGLLDQSHLVDGGVPHGLEDY